MKIEFCKNELLQTNRYRWFVFAFCLIAFFGVAATKASRAISTNEARDPLSMYKEFLAMAPQSANLDYSTFKHNSQKHASLECSSCHLRTDNSVTPRFPGHKACTGCHVGQFVTPAVPMCVICHTDVNSSKPPLKNFPTKFNESFNVKFDHAQHMTGNARPRNGCSSCHTRLGGRAAAALSIPATISAHNQCYTCHTPGSRSSNGRDIASCGSCHDERGFSRTPTNARSFRFAFSHGKHLKIACNDCHNLVAGAPQMRQVTSPAPAEHFASRGSSCASCHNGRRSFGGDLAFKDCKRCHTSSTFRMPM